MKSESPSTPGPADARIGDAVAKVRQLFNQAANEQIREERGKTESKDWTNWPKAATAVGVNGGPWVNGVR